MAYFKYEYAQSDCECNMVRGSDLLRPQFLLMNNSQDHSLWLLVSIGLKVVRSLSSRSLTEIVASAKHYW